VDTHQFLTQTLVFLVAGVAFVPMAQKLGLGAVLGYLIAGFLIGPNGLAVLGNNIEDIMHFAEFGVVMLLFIIGLELRPSRLWAMRVSIFGMGALQVGFTTLVICLFASWLEVTWQEALALGMVFALSSTAITLQTLAERRLLNTPEGKDAFSILLFQDIAVIPMLALLPLLSFSTDSNAGAKSLSENLTYALIVFAVIGSIVMVGKYAIRPVFRTIAETGLRELFTGFALLIVVGIALLMDSIDLSAALGTFVAGVVLADSEYRHELESELEPFKGLLLGLFFISVGASMDIQLFLSDPGRVLLFVALLMLIKASSIIVIARLFKRPLGQAIRVGLFLAQGGEFGFVLFSFALKNHVLSAETVQLAVLVIALSMVFTPIAINLGLKWTNAMIVRRIKEQAPEYDTLNDHGLVILAGYGRFGQIIGRVLRHSGYEITVLEREVEQVELVRKFGSKVFYGDASRMDLLHAAGAHNALAIVLATDDHERNKQIFTTCKKHFPNLKIFARARGRIDAYEWLQLGADYVVRETFHSALEMSRSLLHTLGFRKHQAHRLVKTFQYHDLDDMVRVAAKTLDENGYIFESNKNRASLEAVLREEKLHQAEFHDEAWIRPSERADNTTKEDNV
jgi:monovalent cation:proton antiporter-2 (CPA2) family protein